MPRGAEPIFTDGDTSHFQYGCWSLFQLRSNYALRGLNPWLGTFQGWELCIREIIIYIYTSYLVDSSYCGSHWRRRDTK